MQDDFTVFWRNNDRAYELFQDLLVRAAKNAYDDDFLAQLAAYRAESPASENADIFAAQYLLHHGDVENAVSCGERAYAKRPLNHEILKILAVAYKELHRAMDSLVMQGRAYGLYGTPKLALSLTANEVEEGLGRLTLALGKCFDLPLATGRAHVENGELSFRFDVFIGEEIPMTMPDGSARFWSGIYTENAGLSDHSYMLAAGRHSDWFIGYAHRDFFFDLQKARTACGTVSLSLPPGRTAVVPVAGTEPDQPLAIQTADGAHEAALGKWAFSFFHLHADAELRSDAPYAVGTPILLGHSPQRRRLVLNIFVDALSWAIARPYAATHLPNIMRFFAHGTIFDQHFSTSEFTFPAYPAIETGYYPHHTHIFNTFTDGELPSSMRTTAEQMKELGYYCAAPMAQNQLIPSGTMRGFDRIVSSSWVQHSIEGVDRVLCQIRAFEECDQYLLLVVNDVHPYNVHGYKVDTTVETHLPLSARFPAQDKDAPSVRLAGLRIYQEQYLERMRQTDRNLGLLFSEIEQSFAEEEYLVNLYSDHGASVFSNVERVGGDVMSELSTSATWMMRGAGVPEGIVTQELTSTVDLYPTLGHLCGFPVAHDIDGNLPAVFGGTARDVVYSASQYSGQTYKLAVRTHDHALRLETQGIVRKDGTADFAEAVVGIYPRGHELEKAYAVDSAELRRFFYPRARNFVREIANNGEVFG